jgi:long-chain acyl-CoA synthetase
VLADSATGAAPGTDVTADEVMRHCERKLARFKCPAAFEFAPRLPHSATGKVRKAAVRTPAEGMGDE